MGIGLRWWNLNRQRALHAWLGGGAGGFMGGLLFASIGSQAADLSQALGFVLTGTGITFGVNAAPVLMSQGLLQFVSSGDLPTQRKYGPQQKSWELQKGDRYLIGSLGADRTTTLYSQEVQIFLPDEQVAPRHAILTVRGGRFCLERHAESFDPMGLFQYPLQVQGRDVDRMQELRDGDTIRIGRTQLCFRSRRPAATETVPRA